MTMIADQLNMEKVVIRVQTAPDPNLQPGEIQITVLLLCDVAGAGWA